MRCFPAVWPWRKLNSVLDIDGYTRIAGPVEGPKNRSRDGCMCQRDRLHLALSVHGPSILHPRCGDITVRRVFLEDVHDDGNGGAIPTTVQQSRTSRSS